MPESDLFDPRQGGLEQTVPRRHDSAAQRVSRSKLALSYTPALLHLHWPNVPRCPEARQRAAGLGGLFCFDIRKANSATPAPVQVNCAEEGTNG